MTTPADAGIPAEPSPPARSGRLGQILIAVVALSLAGLFFYHPGKGRPRRPIVLGPHGSAAVDSADTTEHATAKALEMSGPALSPADTIEDPPQFDVDYRSRQMRLCRDRAAAAVAEGGQGVGTAHVQYGGYVDDSILFDGAAQSTGGRAMVWRCTIATNAGYVGQMGFTPADSAPGVALRWNPIATLDDYVLRRCLVRAQKLFPDKTVPLHAAGRRHDNHVRLVGTAQGNGVGMNWNCIATVDGDSIVALDARVGG